MLKNYFTVAIRNLFRNKLYAVINTIGLTIGMTCFILIALYIQYELNYDQHFEKSDRIYRVEQEQKGNPFRGTELFNVAPLPLTQELRKGFPEVETATTIQFDNIILGIDEKIFTAQGLYADQYVFDVFDIQVLAGEGGEILNEPNSILLTVSLAEKIFGEENPVGKTLAYNNQKDVVVRGIIPDPSNHQHFTYSYISSLHNLGYFEHDLTSTGTWVSNNYKAYVLLKPGASHKAVEDKMLAFEKYTEPAYSSFSFRPRYFLQPLEGIYLSSKSNFQNGATSDLRYIYLFGAVGFIILLLASINYMNLATARSANRSKEVGIRKVLGAYRKQIITQFLGESFILTLVSFVLALIVVLQVLPVFNEWFDRNIPFSLIGNGGLLVGMFALALLVGGLSGLYPAVFVSAISPVKAFQGSFFNRFKQGMSLRNALVVGQFTAAVVLAISTICIYQQLNYIQKKKLGYNREQVIYVTFNDDDVFNRFSTVKQELLNSPDIRKVSLAVNLPLNTYNQGIIDDWEGNEGKRNLGIYRNFVDYDFLDLFEIDLVKGRFFSPEHATDSTDAYVINEAAVKAIGWEEPIGKSFRGGKVVGVVKDFHFQPLDLEIQPQFLGLIYGQGYYRFANVIAKVDVEHASAAREHIQSTMKSLFPKLPLEAQYLDDTYQKMYESETRFGQIFSFFTMIALLIACMGLFGLVSHQVLQRTKEIGIRKVLGASTFSIVGLISKDFLKLILLALFLAIPIAWYLMDQWLQNFVYHISIEWWIFILAGIMTIAIALLTVSIQSIRAALSSPSESLRTE